MGRKKLDITDEERAQRARDSRKKYYENNKEKFAVYRMAFYNRNIEVQRAKAMERYYRKKLIVELTEPTAKVAECND